MATASGIKTLELKVPRSLRHDHRLVEVFQEIPKRYRGNYISTTNNKKGTWYLKIYNDPSNEVIQFARAIAERKGIEIVSVFGPTARLQLVT